MVDGMMLAVYGILIIRLYTNTGIKTVIQKEKTMNIYYIDYENVSSLGLKGIELLSETDEVNLLYSKKAETMKIDMLTQIMASKARIHFLPVHVGTPNALDFQLITLLFLHYTDENRYFIISKDSGYDCCIKTALENGAVNVARFSNIESAVRGKQPERTQRSRRSSRRGQASEETLSSSPALDASATAEETGSIQQQEAQTGASQQQDLQTGASQQQDLRQMQEQHNGENSQDAAPQRSSRRRGRRKSSSGASQEQAVQETEQQAAEVHSDQQPSSQAEEARQVQDPVHDQEIPAQNASSPSQRSSGRGRNSRKNASGNSQRQQNGKDDAQKGNGQHPQNGFERQQNGKDDAQKASDKPVTILSVIRRRNDVQLDLNQIEMIRDALKTTKNKQQFYNYFAKKLGQKKGIELYHSIKSSYTDLINANLV